MSENLSGSTMATFVVMLSSVQSEPITVNWYTEDGSGKAGIDYKAASGSLTFAPGEQEKIIQIEVYGRDPSQADAGSRTFNVRLKPSPEAILSTTFTECTIYVTYADGTPYLSVIVATGPKGTKGDPGLNAYELAVLRGYKGTLDDWMQEIADASAAAARAEGFRDDAESAADRAEAAATSALFGGRVFETPEEGVDPITGVPDGHFFNVRSASSDSYLDEYRNEGGNAVATGKSYPSAEVLARAIEKTRQATENLREQWRRSLADAGLVLVAGSFEEGATISSPSDAVWHIGAGQCYTWGGTLPKTVTAGSTPGSTGGISENAWVSVSSKSLKAVLGSDAGASIVLNGKDSLNNFLPHTPGEFYSGGMDAALSSSLAATAVDGRKTLISGEVVLSSAATIPDGAKVENNGKLKSSENNNLPVLWMGNNTRLTGGKIESTGRSQAVRAEGKSNVNIDGVDAESTFVTSNSLPAYAYDFYSSTDVNLTNLTASAYTGGVAFTGTKRVRARGLNFKSMKYHPALVAGGYGALIGTTDATIIGDLFFKVGGDGYGRHGFYLTAGCKNTIFNCAVMDYSDQPATTQPPGGINIRQNDRAILSNVIIDGSRITSNAENGHIAAQLITNNIVASYKHTASPSYGIALEDSGSYRPRGNSISLNLVSVAPKADAGVDNQLCYSIVVSGQDNLYLGNVTNVPALSYPYLVRANATNCLIQGGLDHGPAQNSGVAFILFDGAASNIAIKGCKTNRPWFRAGNLANVTDLTVDWARSCAVAINSGTASYEDTNELIASTAVSATNIVVTFNSHVTAAALNAATVTTRKSSAMTIPVITARSGKTLTIEFYSLATGALINPSTTGCAATITLFS